MKYFNIVDGKFISRPNRFVANVEINGLIETVHVKNTGRCKELLKPNSKVLLEDFIGRMGKRKLRYDIVSVYKENMLVNMDSLAPNKVVFEALNNNNIFLDGFSNLKIIKPETFYQDSRFDFYIEDENGKKGFLEVKGVTLEENGICSFPDAPTTRGSKHVLELIKALDDGYSSFILFVIQMKGMKELRPNYINDPIFSNNLKLAKEKGVKILAYECVVERDSLNISNRVKVNI